MLNLIIAAGQVPEIPNILTLLYDLFPDSSFMEWIYHHESIIFSLFISILLSIFLSLAIRSHELIPSSIQNFLEWISENMNWVFSEVLGESDAKKFFPFLATLFVYILTMNLAGLLPFMKSPTSNINITAALAICVFFLVQFLNIRNMGFFGFMHHLFGSPKDTVGWIMVPLMFPIELITQISRPITLALRLFGNILGEKLLMALCTLFGIWLLSGLNSPVGMPFQIPFMFFALFTGSLQAFIFTLLSSVYIVLSIPHEEEHLY